MSAVSPDLPPLATFCGQCSCGCPQLYVDPDAGEERKIIITDDFGHAIRMSSAQLGDLIAQARAGALDAAAEV